jgi:hypothetical protein
VVGGFVLLAASGTYAAVKLSQQDAQRIEEHTGIPPDELEDADLEEAMQELNIQSEPLSAEDQAAMGQGTEPATATAATAAPSSGEASYLQELEKLGELRDKGIITDAEFEAKKKELLGL